MTTTATIDRLLTPKDAAARLSVSKKTLMEHVKSGALPFIDLGAMTRRRYRFRRDHIESFLDRREGRLCPSSSVKTARFTTASSKSTVVAFSSLQKPATGKKPKPPRSN